MAISKGGLLGRKIGMTQIYDDAGNVQGVTVVEIGPNTVVKVKTADSKDGYNAVQLAFGSQKASRSSKAELGHARRVNAELTAAPRTLKEIRVEAGLLATYEEGKALTAGDLFKAGDMVDVQGTSKGRGFAGVMKRHNMSGFKASHGVHEYYRHGGSIGTRLTPGMTFKGVKMPGQYGNTTASVQNLRLVRLDAERNLVYILGGVPGPNGGTVLIKKATKA